MCLNRTELATKRTPGVHFKKTLGGRACIFVVVAAAAVCSCACVRVFPYVSCFRVCFYVCLPCAFTFAFTCFHTRLYKEGSLLISLFHTLQRAGGAYHGGLSRLVYTTYIAAATKMKRKPVVAAVAATATTATTAMVGQKAEHSR